MAEQSKVLFSPCGFAVVRGTGKDVLTDSELSRLCDTIRLHSASVTVDNYPDERLDLGKITHIISNTSDFPDYEKALDHMIPVVKPSWIESCLVKNKLVNTRQYNPDPQMFMSDVIACCADDLPEGDREAIAGGILAMGGLYTQRLTNQVTHVVALSMEAEPCITVESKRLRVKIVLPHWFDDCLKLGRKIDEQPYLLPDPELFKSLKNIGPRGGPNPKVAGAVHPDPSLSPPPTPENGEPPRHVFRKKVVMLSPDLGIGLHLREILEGIIRRGQGEITVNVAMAHMFICKYRSGPEYKAASLANKDVGNLAWLYYLIAKDTWTSPLRRLLHYPVARRGIPGFENYRISLSNYSGEARTYLENLMVAAGAECTKTLKQDNTHLVTAHVLSEKCAAARDWNIHIVNHLWLEESYAKWQVQSVSNPRYTHFPQQTNLGEIVGSTQVDREVLKQRFLTATNEPDIEEGDTSDTPRQPPPNQEVNQITKPSTEAQTRSSSPIPHPNTKVSETKLKPLTKQSTRNQTPTTNRVIGVGKENITPSTTGSRKSKEAAAAKLHNMTPDIALYEKERKRVGGVVYGGRKAEAEAEDQPAQARKRSMDEASEDEDVEVNGSKKARRGLPQPELYLLISRYQKWIGHPRKEDADKKQLRNLGIVVTVDPARASHLAAPSILRTPKFVTALAYAPVIISTEFIDACLENNEAQDPDHYLLEDKVNEKKFGLSLKLSRERAKENRNQLLNNRPIFVLENIHGSFDTYKSIIEANGGQCMPFRNRKGQMVPSTRAGSAVNGEDEADNEVYLVSDTDKEHKNLNEKIWIKFREMAEASRKIPRIVNTDWLIESAMSQKILPVAKYEIESIA